LIDQLVLILEARADLPRYQKRGVENGGKPTRPGTQTVLRGQSELASESNLGRI
jgi:hypothetical protein